MSITSVLNLKTSTFCRGHSQIRMIQNRITQWLLLAITALIVAGCATSVQHSSGRLARVTPKDFITIKPEDIIVGVDMDSRVPATPSRGPDFRVAVFPVDHDAWEPIGGRLRMRPLNMLGETPDKGAGKAMAAWLNPRAGRLRLAYVLTEESAQELKLIQKKFDDLLKRYPPGSGKKGVLRLGADTRFLINADQQAGQSTMATWLQLSIAEGPFLMWQGRIDEMR
ncbi:MAG: hypothetical protein WBD13_23470 [Burkholderiaceae bacterium]